MAFSSQGHSARHLLGVAVIAPNYTDYNKADFLDLTFSIDSCDQLIKPVEPDNDDKYPDEFGNWNGGYINDKQNQQS
jgi:hypothetical protein